LAEEWVYEVRGLAAPPATLDPAQVTVEMLHTYSAASLFLDRAAQVAPDFAPPPGSAELAAVARICRLLEGMPLALELAAAWVHMLPCVELADELARNLDFLSATQRDLPSRHRSLRAVFDHSWAQLGQDDQEALARLTIFAGGFDRVAANCVAQAALPGLASLVNKSLVQVVTAGRYRLHDLVRQFAAEKVGDEARPTLRDAHAGYFAGWLAGLEGDLFGAEQRRALELVQTDIENVRAAWLWSVAHAKPHWIGQALRSLYQFYYIRCWTDEATEMLQYAESMLLDEVAAPGSAARPDSTQEAEIILGHLLAQLGNAHYSAGHLGDAERYLVRALDYCRRYAELATVEVYCRQELGLTFYAQGNYAQAQTFLAEALPLARQLGLAQYAAHIGLGLGVVELALGRWDAAQHNLAAALARYDDLGYQWGVAHAQRWVGLAAWQTGKLAAADAALRRARELCQAIGDRTGEALALNDLGGLALAAGQLEACRTLLLQCWEMAQADQNHMLRSRVLKNMGCLLRAEGRMDDAQRYFVRAIQGAMTAQTTQLVLEIMVELAQLWQAIGRLPEAASLCAFAAAHPAAVYAVQRRAAEIARTLPAPQTTLTLDAWVEQLLETHAVQEIDRQNQTRQEAP
jgi:tetratricopeptide (TPR) repeat protein